MKLFLSTILVIAIGCKGNNSFEIKRTLGVYLPPNARNIHYEKIAPNLDYVRPYSILLKFSIDSLGFNSLVKELAVLPENDSTQKILCIEHWAEPLKSKFWSFERAKSFNQVTIFDEIDWWDPNSTKLDLFAGFYNEKADKKVLHCSKRKWDGRILVGYSAATGICYLIIEVLMQ